MTDTTPSPVRPRPRRSHRRKVKTELENRAIFAYVSDRFDSELRLQTKFHRGDVYAHGCDRHPTSHEAPDSSHAVRRSQLPIATPERSLPGAKGVKSIAALGMPTHS